MWTTFWDMHSGGRTKEPPYEKIYIEAPEDEAMVIFYNRFGHNPDRVSCTCCGSDYSIYSHDDLLQATAYHRGCEYDSNQKKYVDSPSTKQYSFNEYCTLEEYESRDDVLIIRAAEIKDTEREGDVPDEGYVWV